MREDYLEEDQPIEEVLRDWDSGERVLVIPSRLRRRLRAQHVRLRHFFFGKLQRVLSELHRGVDRINWPAGHKLP